MAPSARGARSHDEGEGLQPSLRSCAQVCAPLRFGFRGAESASGSVPWHQGPALSDPVRGHEPQLAVSNQYGQAKIFAFNTSENIHLIVPRIQLEPF